MVNFSPSIIFIYLSISSLFVDNTQFIFVAFDFSLTNDKNNYLSAVALVDVQRGRFTITVTQEWEDMFEILFLKESPASSHSPTLIEGRLKPKS